MDPAQVLPTEREREELTCPPSILGDAERDRALAVTRGARGGAGPGGGDPGLPAEVWRRRLGGVRRSVDRALAATRGRAEERRSELGSDEATGLQQIEGQ
jgi:hypothetical protein